MGPARQSWRRDAEATGCDGEERERERERKVGEAFVRAIKIKRVGEDGRVAWREWTRGREPVSSRGPRWPGKDTWRNGSGGDSWDRVAAGSIGSVSGLGWFVWVLGFGPGHI